MTSAEPERSGLEPEAAQVREGDLNPLATSVAWS